MSDTDSFIDEVTEEVRRDRMYALLRRYGWIGALFILLVVAGVAWQTIRTDQREARAQALGDQMLNAMELPSADMRITALADVQSEEIAALAVRDFLLAASQLENDDVAGARDTLQRIETNPDVPLIYRQIASFKALAAADITVSPEQRRAGLEALAQPGGPLRVLAEEQLALLDIEFNEIDAAVERLQRLLTDAEVTPDLQQRALQVIVALGAEPDLSFLEGGAN